MTPVTVVWPFAPGPHSKVIEGRHEMMLARVPVAGDVIGTGPLPGIPAGLEQRVIMVKLCPGGRGDTVTLASTTDYPDGPQLLSTKLEAAGWELVTPTW